MIEHEESELQQNAELAVLADEIRETLADGRVALLRWEPHNGKAYELMIVPWCSIATMEQGDVKRPLLLADAGHDGWTYIARGYTSALYPVRLWDENEENGRCPHPSYLAEKLAKGDEQDGAALHLLLCAVAECEPVCGWADAGVRV